MEMPLKKNAIEAVTLLSVVYLVIVKAVPHLVKILENSDRFVGMIIEKSLDKIDPFGEWRIQRLERKLSLIKS